MFRDEEKLRRGAQITKSSIDIYSLSGKSIRNINVGGDESLSVLTARSLANIASGTKVLSKGWVGQTMKNYS